ncbi:MAG: prepilin-type N-terminal cleavage/methylation domain-containing protein [Clostridiales bacterium]|nr:prepilin-type N-terminal cleavage/methylation domain-containing protein [Clostridiales bacterium]
MAARRAILCKNNRAASAKGFTLVEMVVVLVVLSIVAAAGIATTIGYVRRSQFTQNEKNAETIYQAAQTSLLQMDKSGKISEFVQTKVLNIATPFQYVAENQSSNIYLEKQFVTDAGEGVPSWNNFDPNSVPANTSVHMRYVLTYNPSSSESSQSTLLKEIIQPYFYDATIFAGMVALELDVEKSVDSYKQIHYSAKCLSVFASSRCKDGWDSEAYGDGNASQKVPARASSYRKNTSLVGYYDGYSGTSVDTVFLPAVSEGLTVRTLKYDETNKSISWTATLDGENLTGSDNHVYYQIELYKGSSTNTTSTAPVNATPYKVLIINEDFLDSEKKIESPAQTYDYFTELAKPTVVNESVVNGYTVTVETYDVVYSATKTKPVTRKTITIDKALVYKAGSENYKTATPNNIKDTQNFYPLKLHITYVDGELDEKLQDKKAYIEYTLELGELMTDEISSVKMTIWPNEFTNNNMTGLNDMSGLIPFKKGKEIKIKHT